MAAGNGGQIVNLQNVLQACTVCVLVWFGGRIVTVSEVVAVHEFRLNDQTQRIQEIQGKRL